MRASDGRHFAGLDHVRALAAFLVVFWHVAHGAGNAPVPLGQAPELGLLDEGHVGVSLFMVLSGYLFAKLIGDKRIDYGQFMANRLMRLLPLTFFTLLLYGLLKRPDDLGTFALELASDLWVPHWPVGTWSIVIELQFYLLLPVLLLLVRRWPNSPWWIVAAMVAVRLALHASGANIQDLAYVSLIGRIDQFLIGIYIAKRPASGREALLGFAMLYLFYAWFAAVGGFFDSPYPVLWVFIPTIEAIGFAGLISWYDRRPFTGPLADLVGKAGTYSFGIYLSHKFVLEALAPWLDSGWMSNVYIALPVALAFFAGMTVVGAILYRLVEAPFLRKRRPYILKDEPVEPVPLPAQMASLPR